MCEIKKYQITPDIGVGKKGEGFSQYLVLDEGNPAYAIAKSQEIINLLKEGADFAEVCKTGWGQIGVERETFAYNRDNFHLFDLPPEKQEELLRCMREIAGQPQIGLRNVYLEGAEEIIHDLRGPYFASTSVPIGGSPKDMRINSSTGEGSIGEYIRYFVSILQNDLINRYDPNDPSVAKLDRIAKRFGMQNCANLAQNLGFGPIFPFASQHRNLALPSYEVENAQQGAHVMNSEIAISAGDMMCADVMGLAEAMCASTPIIWGWLTSWTDVRYAMRQANPRAGHPKMVMTRERLVENIEHFITSGAVNNISRAGYAVTDFNDNPHPAVYGTVRLHVGAKDVSDHGPRVECVALSATPDPIANACADALIMLTQLKAIEATAQNTHPAIFYSGKYGDILSSTSRRNLIDDYVNGDNNAFADISKGALEMIDDIEKDYPKSDQIQNWIKLARFGISRISSQNKSESIVDFFYTGKGNISDAIRNEFIKNGRNTANLLQNLSRYEAGMANLIKRFDGDILQVMTHLGYI